MKTTRGTESDGLSFQIKQPRNVQPGRIVGKNDKGKGQLTAGRKKVYILAIGSSWNSCKRKQISWPSGIFWPGHVQLTHLDTSWHGFFNHPWVCHIRSSWKLIHAELFAYGKWIHPEEWHWAHLGTGFSLLETPTSWDRSVNSFQDMWSWEAVEMHDVG